MRFRSALPQGVHRLAAAGLVPVALLDTFDRNAGKKQRAELAVLPARETL